MPVLDFDYRYEQKNRHWPNTPASSNIRKLFDKNGTAFLHNLMKLSALEPHFLSIPIEQDASNPLVPYWINRWIPPLDAITLAGLVALRRPKTYMEVGGSGNSTMFVRH